MCQKICLNKDVPSIYYSPFFTDATFIYQVQIRRSLSRSYRNVSHMQKIKIDSSRPDADHDTAL